MLFRSRRRQAFRRADVEELEGHLRDQLTALTEAGLSADEAFLVAVKRMGSLDALSREFARAHSERLWKQLVIGAADHHERHQGHHQMAGEQAEAAAQRGAAAINLEIGIRAGATGQTRRLRGLGSC